MKARWHSFMIECNHNPKFRIVSKAAPIFRENELILETDNSFVLDNLNFQKTDLQAMICEFYSAQISLRIDLVQKIANNEFYEIRESANFSSENNKFKQDNSSQDFQNIDEEELNKRHPLEREIIKLFNAKVIKDS